MSCEWRAQIEPYVDDELPQSAAAEMEAHLRGCPDCASEAVARLRMKRRTQAAGHRFTAPPDLRRRIENRIGTRRPAPWKYAVAAAVVLALCGAAWSFLRLAPDRPLVELADLHVATVASAHPVDVISSDRHTVKPWFQGRIPFSFNLPELAGTPFQLIGGRVAWLRQNPGAHLLFQIREHRISAFIFQERPEWSRLSQSGAFAVETWTQDGLRYFLIGDANAADLGALRSLLVHANQRTAGM